MLCVRLLLFTLEIKMSNKIVIRSGLDRLRYAVMFELVLVATFGVALSYLFERAATDTVALAAVLSTKALIINLIYNNIYDRVDARHGRIPTERTLLGRAIHAVGFETILLLTSLPIMMWWLGMSLWETVLLDLGMMSFVVVYTFFFTLLYDKCFPVLQPDASAQTAC
jgi:uncharacterized membrane protein